MQKEDESREWKLMNQKQEIMFSGDISTFVKNSGTELVFIAKEQESFHAYYNGKIVWESPTHIVNFVYLPERARHAAVVWAPNPNELLIKTSFRDITGVYESVYGLEIVDDDQIYFFARPIGSEEWMWYLDGKQKPMEESVREVSTVALGGKEMGAMVNLQSDHDIDATKWTFVSSRGDKVSLPGTPLGIQYTRSGWKAVIRESSGDYIYNILGEERVSEHNEISLIHINSGSDLWFAARPTGESNWRIYRGDEEVKILVKYIAPIWNGEQPYLLGEQPSGSVDLYLLNK